VLVHGLATSMAFWYPQIASRLTAGNRVTLYDLRGHGRSAMTRSGYTPATMADDLRRLLDHLGIERAHLVGHSFGGVVALRLACADQSRVASLMLADTHIGFSRRAGVPWKGEARFRGVVERLGLALDTADPYFGYRLLKVVAAYRARGEEVPAELNELVSPFEGAFSRRSSLQWLRLLEETEAEREIASDDGLTPDRLAALSLPILAMYGENSPALATSRFLPQVWSHARFRWLSDAGHFFPLSRSDEVVEEYLAFRSGLDGVAIA
jgi:pimeloyl-ACP methyl ester carboxylesterase